MMVGSNLGTLFKKFTAVQEKLAQMEGDISDSLEKLLSIKQSLDLPK